MKMQLVNWSRIMNKSDHRVKESAIIFGTYINAYSIYKCLKKVGFQGNIYAIDSQNENGKTFLEVMCNDVKIIRSALKTADDIKSALNKCVGEKKYIFFTDEECIDIVKAAIKNNEITNTVAYTGSEINNELIFNRYEFYKYIEDNQLAPVPKTISSRENPFDIFGDKFIVRPNNSWEGNIKTPRLSIIDNQEKLDEIEEEYKSLGMQREMWSYQELLSSINQHNLSVCGWYEETNKLFVVTRKVLQHPPKTGCGDVIEIVKEYPNTLLEYTDNILRKLKYRGPFEMEFVYDLKSKRYCVIELNPRYWMQHELIEENTNYYLIRKNLEQECELEVKFDYKYWINTNQFVFRLLKGRFSLLKYLEKSVKAPGVMKTLKWAKYYFESRK